MKKILITGGTGVVGTAFIKKYYSKFNFFTYSRGERNIAYLKNNYPNVKTIIGDIKDLEHLINVYERIKPDIVIHAAALKHVNLAELNPKQTIENNVIGSLNVIKASIRTKTPLTIGISTDKACSPENIYGYSKKMMESMFLEHHNLETRFVCTRFANVADCEGSVIPYWKELVKNNKPLKLTDKRMNRLMFTTSEAAELIFKAINYSNKNLKDSFILSKIMKTINMFDLANVLSSNIEIIGIRSGEKLNETLISTKDLPFTKILDNYILIFKQKQEEKNRFPKELSSLTAKKMNKKEIKNLLK
jgi:UDP-N-acetylglucosamine 4,6-dehydratase